MFTGIIEATGTVAKLTQIREEWRLVVAVGGLSMSDVQLGDSIAGEWLLSYRGGIRCFAFCRRCF
jgi:riboflavin synthase alpha subunit